jgi:Flp pilus assembly protein CpaB
MVGIGAALLAAILLVVFLSQYRNSVNQAGEGVTVLVAKRLIQQGTPGDVVGSLDLYANVKVRKSQLKTGAIIDPASLRGRYAVKDIYPNEQLTTADFTAATSDSVVNKISGIQRAITLPLDGAHGMIGDVQAGDDVEVLAGFQLQRINPDGTPAANSATRPLLRVVVPKALVLQAPKSGSGGKAGDQKTVVLRVTDRQAAELAFASDNGKVWIVLRPKTGAKVAQLNVVSLESMMLGMSPIRALHSFGGRR